MIFEVRRFTCDNTIITSQILHVTSFIHIAMPQQHCFIKIFSTNRSIYLCSIFCSCFCNNSNNNHNFTINNNLFTQTHLLKFHHPLEEGPSNFLLLVFGLLCKEF